MMGMIGMLCAQASHCTCTLVCYSKHRIFVMYFVQTLPTNLHKLYIIIVSLLTNLDSCINNNEGSNELYYNHEPVLSIPRIQ